MKPACSRARRPKLLKPVCLEPVLCNEKPPQCEARTPQLESSPRRLELEKARAAKKTPHIHI